MAEEIRANLPTGNGERLSLQIGSKAFSLTSRDLISVLLVAGMAVGFYLTVQSFTERHNRSFANQETEFRKLEGLLEVMHQHQKEMVAAIRHNLDISGTLMHDHNRLLVEKWDEIIRHQMANAHEERRQHAVLMYNMAREPSDHLPLELSPPERREGGR